MKASIALFAPIQDKVAALASKVPHFWKTSLLNCSDVSVHIPKIDHDAMSFLQDVKLVHQADDVRNFEVTFVRFFPRLHRTATHTCPPDQTFAENPYFSNTTLTKAFTVKAPEGEEQPRPFDIAADLYLVKGERVAWKSDDKNLVKLAPKIDLDEVDLEDTEFDEVRISLNLFGSMC